MEGFLHFLGGLMVTIGFVCVIAAIVVTLIQFFASLDPYTTVAGAAGFVNPITTIIMLIIFVFTQPDKMFMPTLLTIIGFVLIVFGAPLSG
uniref:Uncharacterized protein n=1 Tax=candidate division WWE3 bacterium TaxID=2053526 RepID=A0A7C4XTS9_UNCKA